MYRPDSGVGHTRSTDLDACIVADLERREVRRARDDTPSDPHHPW
jgi:hypothetical protein